MFCKYCGREIPAGLADCPACGFSNPSPYRRDTVLLLCLLGFVGFAGIHRFYVGRWVGGALFFLTGGYFGVGTVIDLFKIFRNTFKDADERPVLP